MRAAVRTSYGPPEVVRIAEVAKPAVRGNEGQCCVAPDPGHAEVATSADQIGVDPVWWTPKMRALPSRWESDATTTPVLPAGVQG